MKSESLEISVGGMRLTGHLAYDETRSGKRPGIVVVHEAFGLGPHAKGRAERLAAELGYVAYAMDLFGEPIKDLDHAMQWIGKLLGDPPQLRARVRAALDALAKHSRVDAHKLGAIGYCFGGTTALELARSGADVKAVVAFHAGLQSTNVADAKNIRGKVLVCNGALDPLIGADMRGTFAEEMTAGGVDWQLHLHGRAKHSFTNPDADGSGPFAYDHSADVRSWAAMAALFAEVFAETAKK
jgi:dienelactone hydrolase